MDRLLLLASHVFVVGVLISYLPSFPPDIHV